jgi:hypothetical protein
VAASAAAAVAVVSAAAAVAAASAVVAAVAIAIAAIVVTKTQRFNETDFAGRSSSELRPFCFLVWRLKTCFAHETHELPETVGLKSGGRNQTFLLVGKCTESAAKLLQHSFFVSFHVFRGTSLTQNAF